MQDNNLSSKKCIPCQGGVPPIPDEELQKLLPQVPDWYIEEGKLVRNFNYKNFKEALAFINRVGDLAEFEGHHPDILLHAWNKVKLLLYTHKINGLHENDFILASKISRLV